MRQTIIWVIFKHINGNIKTTFRLPENKKMQVFACIFIILTIYFFSSFLVAGFAACGLGVFFAGATSISFSTCS